jgi:hypothetical protein
MTFLIDTLPVTSVCHCPLPVLATFAGLDGAGGEVCFALRFVVVDGDDDVGEQDDVGDDGGGGAGVG